MAEIPGDLTTVSFAESGFDMNIEAIESLSINGTKIPTLHLGSPAGIKPFIKSRFFEAEMSLRVQFDPTKTIPLNRTESEAITIDWGATGNTDVFTGFVLSFDMSTETEALITGTATVVFDSYVSGGLMSE